MKKIQRIFLSLTIACIPVFHLLAQETGSNQIYIGYHPQYLIIHGLKMDVEILFGNNYRSSLIIAPAIFYDVASYETDYFVNAFNAREYNQMTAYGIDLHHRYYINRKVLTNTYFEYGLSFRHSVVMIKMHDWNRDVFDGNSVWAFTPDEKHFGITKFGGDLVFGLQRDILNKMTVDLYAGAAMRYGSDDEASNDELSFNDNMLDLGFTGVLPLAGMRVGLKIR